MKVRSSRGENWLLASCSVTTVREKVSAVTVISELEMAASTVRPADGLPPKSRSVSHCGNADWMLSSLRGSSTPAISASAMPRHGSGHNWVRNASRTAAVQSRSPNRCCGIRISVRDRAPRTPRSVR